MTPTKVWLLTGLLVLCALLSVSAHRVKSSADEEFYRSERATKLSDFSDWHKWDTAHIKDYLQNHLHLSKSGAKDRVTRLFERNKVTGSDLMTWLDEYPDDNEFLDFLEDRFNIVFDEDRHAVLLALRALPHGRATKLSDFVNWNRWDVDHVKDYLINHLHLTKGRSKDKIVRTFERNKITGDKLARWLDEHAEDSKLAEFLQNHLDLDVEDDSHSLVRTLRSLPRRTSSKIKDYSDWDSWDTDRLKDYLREELHISKPSTKEKILKMFAEHKINGKLLSKWFRKHDDDHKFLEFLDKHFGIDFGAEKHRVMKALRRLSGRTSSKFSDLTDWHKWDAEDLKDYLTEQLSLPTESAKERIVGMFKRKKIDGKMLAKWLDKYTEDSKLLDFLDKHLDIDIDDERHAVLKVIRKLPSVLSLYGTIKHSIKGFITSLVFSPFKMVFSAIWFVMRVIGLGGVVLTLIGATDKVKRKANADIVSVHDKYMSWLGYYEGKIRPVGAETPRVPHFLLSACYFLGYPLSIAYCYLKQGAIASSKLAAGFFGILLLLTTFMGKATMAAIWSVVYLALDFSGYLMVIMLGWLIKQWITTPPKSASAAMAAPTPLSPKAEKLKSR